jgi:hypothetical protein
LLNLENASGIQTGVRIWLYLTIISELNCKNVRDFRVFSKNEWHKLFNHDSFKLFLFLKYISKVDKSLVKRQKQNLVCVFNYCGVGEARECLRGSISFCLSTSWMDLLHSDFQTHATSWKLRCNNTQWFFLTCRLLRCSHVPWYFLLHVAARKKVIIKLIHIPNVKSHKWLMAKSEYWIINISWFRIQFFFGGGDVTLYRWVEGS